MSNKRPNLALVLSGGGARGAYEAGVIHYIRTMLPPEISRKRRFDVLCGSSVGAINICILASQAHDLLHQGHHIYQAWKHLEQKNVYKRDALSFAKMLTQSFMGISRNVFSRLQDEDIVPAKKKHFKGILNTSPLIPFLENHISWGQISVNIRNELIKAVSLTTTNVHTGKLELFVEKHPSVPYTGAYICHDTKLEHIHALASSALPVLFKAVRIRDQYYIDGSLRLNTPMSPAIQLGADKILVVGMHQKVNKPEDDNIERPFIRSVESPSLGLLLGKILSAIFLDRLDYDIEQMERINRIIKWADQVYGDDFISRVNEHLLENNIKGDIANRGLKRLTAMQIFPSQDIREVFMECVEGQQIFSKGLTSLERFLLKILDVDLHSGKDILSFIMFHPKYLNRLLELGFEDARARHDDLIEFMSDETVSLV